MTKLLRVLLFILVFVALLFGSAGRLDLPWFWAYVAVICGVGIVLVSINDPGLARERTRPGPGGIDRNLRAIVAPMVLVHYVVAGLDVGRFHWSPRLPSVLQTAGLVGVAAGLSFIAWAIATNTFFSPVVRIQEERGHRLITTGPYAHVRHPGYLGMVLAFLASGPALGSLWSMLPVAGYIFMVLRRARLEDRFLHENLAGYSDYARRVRYRLIPGLW